MNHKRPQKGSEPLKSTPEHLLSRGSSYYELDINYDPRTEHLKLKLLPIDSDGTNEKSSKESVVKEPEKMGNRVLETNVPEDRKSKFKNIFWNSRQVSLETKFKHTNDIGSTDEGKINNKIVFTIKPNLNAKSTKIGEVNTSQIDDKKVEKIKKTRGAFTATGELTPKENSVKKTKENNKQRVDESLLKSCEGIMHTSKTSVKKKKHDSHSENAAIIKKSKKLEGISEHEGSSLKSGQTNPLKKCSSDYQLQKNTANMGNAETEIYYVLLSEQNKQPFKITGNEECSYEYVKKIVKRKSRSKNNIQEQNREFVGRSSKTREETVSTKLKSKTVIVHKTLKVIEDKTNVEKTSKSKEKSKSDRKTHESISKKIRNNTKDSDSKKISLEDESVCKKEKENTTNTKKSNDKNTKKDKFPCEKNTERQERKRYNSPASIEKKDVQEIFIQEIAYSDCNANLVVQENKSSIIEDVSLEKNEILSEKHTVKNSESKNVEPIYIYRAKTKPKIKVEGDGSSRKLKEIKIKAKDESSEKKSSEPMYLFKAESRKNKKEKREEKEDGAKKKKEEKARSQMKSKLSKERDHREKVEEKSLKTPDAGKELKKNQNRRRSKHLTEIFEKDLTASSEQYGNIAVQNHLEENRNKHFKRKESSQENASKGIKEKQKKEEEQTSSEHYKEPISTEDDYLKTKLLKKARAKSKDKAPHDKKSKKSKHSLKIKKKKYKTENVSTDENTNADDDPAKPSKTHNLNDTRTLSRLIENHHKAYLENGLKNKKQSSCPTESSLLSDKRKGSPTRKDQITDALQKSFKKMRSQKIYKMREVNKSSLDSFSSKTQEQCQNCRKPVNFCSFRPPDQNVVDRTNELRHEVSLSQLHIYPDLSQYTTPSRILDINKPILKSPARSQELTKRDKPRKKNSLLKSIEKKTVLSEVITKREKNHYSDQSDLINYYAKPKKRRTRSNQFTRKLVCTENVIETTLRASDENCAAGFVVEGIEPPKRLGFVGENAKINYDKNSKLHKTVFSVMEIESTTINSTDYNTDLSLCEISAFTKSDSSKNDTIKQTVTDIFVHQIDGEKKTSQTKPKVDVDKDDINRTFNIIKDLDSLLADIKQNLPNTAAPKKQPHKSKPKTSTLTKDFFDSQPQYSSDTETTYNISISQDCQTDETQKLVRENRATESPKANITDFVTCFAQNENTNKSFKINIVDTKNKSVKQTDDVLENATSIQNEESNSSRVIRICLGDCFRATEKHYKDQNTDTIEDNDNTKKNSVSKISEHSSKGSIIKRMPKRNVGLEKKLSKVLKINPLIKKRSRDTFEGLFAKSNKRHYLANECVYLLSNILYPVINSDCKRQFFQPKQKTPFTEVHHSKEQIEDNANETKKKQIDEMFVKQKCLNKEEKMPDENKLLPNSTSAIKLESKIQKRCQNIFECSSSKIVDSQLSFQKPKLKGSSLLLTKDYKDTARMKAYQKRKLYGEELRKTNKTNLDWNIKLTPSESETKTKNETVIKFGITQNGTIKKLDEEESRDYKKICNPWDCERTFSTVTLSSKNSKGTIAEQYVDKKRGFTLHSKIEGSSLNIYISNKDKRIENDCSSSSAFLPCQLYVESSTKLAENYEALKNMKRKLEEFEDEKPKKIARKPRLLYSFSDDLTEQISCKNSRETLRKNPPMERKLSQMSLSEDSLEKTDNQNLMDFKKGHNFLVYESLVDITIPVKISDDPLSDLFQNQTDLNYGKEQIITPISDESGYESCKSKKSPSVKKLFKKPSVVFDIFKPKSKNSGSNVECETSKIDVSESESTMSRSVSRIPSISIFKRKSTSFLPWKNFKRPKSVDGSTKATKINIVRRTLSNFFFKKSKLSKNEMPVIVSGSKSSNKILKSETLVEKWQADYTQNDDRSKQAISAECDLRKSISTQTIKNEPLQKDIRDIAESSEQNEQLFESPNSKTVNFSEDAIESPRDSDDEHNKTKNCCPCANIFQKPCFSSKTKTLPDLERIMKDPQKSKLFLKNLEFYQKNMDQCHEYARKISIEKHFKKYNMSKQSNFKEIPLNVLLGKNEKSKIEKSNFAEGDTLHKRPQNSNDLFFDNSNINFLLKKTPLPQNEKCDKVTPPEFFSENVKQVFFCNASYITFPVHEIIIDANKKNQLNNDDCQKICECPCFSDDHQSDSDTSTEENCETTSKNSQNKLHMEESVTEDICPPKEECEESLSKVNVDSTVNSEKCVEAIFVADQKDGEQNEEVDDPCTLHDNETSNIDDNFSREEEEIAEEFMGQVSLEESSESNLHKTPSKEEALKNLQEIRTSMTDQELFNRLLTSFENQDKIANELFSNEDFFATQLTSVKSKKSVDKFLEHQKNQLPIKTSTNETVMFSKRNLKKNHKGKPGTASNENLLESKMSLPKLEKNDSHKKDKYLLSSSSVRQFSETTVIPAEIGMCLRRGFRPDNIALSGESYEADDIVDGSPAEEVPTRKASYINFSERQTPLEYLLALGFSVDEATNAIKNIDVTNRLCAAIREARIWINRISTTQGTLLYLVSFKTNHKIMRYFLQLVEAIINGRINNAVKLDSFIRLLINIENGDVDMIKVFGIGRFEDEVNDDQIVKKQMKKVFADVYRIANEEADKHNKTLSNDSIELLRIVSAKYRAGLVPHLELIARYIGQNLIVNEVQLEAAMIYLSRLNTTNVKLKEFERYCDIKCQKD